jgi:hypothetical protein
MSVVREKETFGVCPSCGGSIFEGEKSFYCVNWKEKGCKVYLPKLIMGRSFGKDEARSFFKNKKCKMSKGILKEGEEVEFYMEYEEDEKKVVIRYGGGENQKSLGKCPKCGKNVYVGKKCYYCEGYKDNPKCEFKLWKETEGAVFTAEMVKEMLAGNKLEKVKCFTIDQKEYEAGFRVNEEGDLVKTFYGGRKLKKKNDEEEQNENELNDKEEKEEIEDEFEEELNIGMEEE